ncbi:MAG: hypothetical protein LBC82_06130 [Oscillospiraceae bacterium]|jgi:hypothetical protein|nr:hypothetical protein [Oscillospiraceae bacterium]
MTKNQKPNKKIVLSPALFNSLYTMLRFFIASEKEAGETTFSKTAIKLKEQIDRYGRFIEKDNTENNMFIIYYFDKEVVQIMKLFVMYTSLRENPSADFFTKICVNKKTQPQRGVRILPTSEKQ